VSSDSLIASLRRLPDLDDSALAIDQHPQLDEWPARLSGIVEPAGGSPVVVAPPDAKAVAALVRWANDEGLRLQALGAGSNVVGAIDDGVSVLVSTERLDRVCAVDRDDFTVTVGAGVGGRELERQLGDQGFTVGHLPQSLHVSTVGGWIATRATGTYSAQYGGIEQIVVGATFVTPTGELVHVPSRPRPSGGLDLLALLCGSEGSFGIVTDAILAVARASDDRRICAAVPDLRSGLAIQRDLVQSGISLGLVRLYNAAESGVAATPGVLEPTECLLVVTLPGPAAVSGAAAHHCSAVVAEFGGRALPATAADPWFAHRYAGPGFMAERNQDPTRIFDTIEVALPWSSAAACSDELEERVGPLSDPLYQHFSHVYRTGVCLYVILHLAADDAIGARRHWRQAWSAALNVVAAHGGTLAHHHGVGALRAARYQASSAGELHRRLARALDPRCVFGAPLLEASDDLLAAGVPAHA
jgi:alkyldihydroxyacetonephosphate synthase